MIEKLIEIADRHGVLDICNILFKDPRFPVCSGASKPHQHHYGNGGLAQHTLEVVELSLSVNAYFKNISKDVRDEDLVLAGVFHDAGKMWDYEQVGASDWQGTKHKRQIHHISRSGIVWTKAVASTGLFIDRENDILHAILAHHGSRTWGSPVAPATRLAWILHLCDGLSARMDDFDKLPDGLLPSPR